MRPTAAVLSALFLTACASTPPPPAQAGPTAMVAAANPMAVRAGLDILRAGGSAADAAVSVQAVLGLVEPQSSGLGGGAFLVHYDAQTGTVTAYDGRETAPDGATADMFLDEAGNPLPFDEAVLSGRSTGVPGAVAMLALAHEDYGKLPWASLFGEAERLAREGFAVPGRMARAAGGGLAQGQADTPDAAAYFTKPDGSRVREGDIVRNPAYADTLRAIAAQGPAAVLEGDIAEAIVASVAREPRPGTLSLEDLAAYRPIRKAPLCAPYRVYVVCTARPPSSGVSLLQALKMLERTDIASRGPADPVAWVQIAEAERLMYADRDHYVGDPAYVRVPVEGLLDAAYVARRAAMIGERAGAAPTHGEVRDGAFAPDATMEAPGTSHFVIVAPDGDVVSMTTTVESMLGSGRMAAGFFLNNELTDFSFSPVDAEGKAAANAVAPGKRPRSSMSPVIVLDGQGRFVAALGSPGGSSILSYNLKALVGVLDWGLTMQQALDLPNMIARGERFVSEPDKFAPGVVEGLKARGVDIEPGGGGSGLHGVIVRETGLEGGADSRGEGVAAGF